MAEKDYYSFEEVLANLRMEEDELKRLVSAGEIRAFRDRETMRFKATDVERIRDRQRGASSRRDELDLDLGDDIQLEADSPGEGEELVLEDEGLETAEEVDLAQASRGPAEENEPRRRATRSVAASAALEEGSEGTGLRFALVVGFVVLVFANFAVLGAIAGQTNSLTRFLADLFAG